MIDLGHDDIAQRGGLVDADPPSTNLMRGKLTTSPSLKPLSFKSMLADPDMISD